MAQNGIDCTDGMHALHCVSSLNYCSTAMLVIRVHVHNYYDCGLSVILVLG